MDLSLSLLLVPYYYIRIPQPACTSIPIHISIYSFLPLEAKSNIPYFVCLIDIPELANSELEACLDQEEECNNNVVRELYKALNSKETETLHGLVAQDLEWWFHGPPCHRHRLVPWLTGSSSSPSTSKALVPDHVVGFGSVVIVEGYDEDNLVWWVHAWTINADGVITQVKEYVNTSVTVTQLGMAEVAPQSHVVVPIASKCQSIWQSTLSDESVPGLILAI